MSSHDHDAQYEIVGDPSLAQEPIRKLNEQLFRNVIPSPIGSDEGG